MRTSPKPFESWVIRVVACGIALATPMLARLRPEKLIHALRAVAPSRPRELTPAEQEMIVSSIDHGVNAARRIAPQTCLTRGVARYILLRRRGVHVELVFGAGVADGRGDGHCWLERAGVPFLEPTDPRDRFHEFLRAT